jgi:hypothetical protein
MSPPDVHDPIVKPSPEVTPFRQNWMALVSLLLAVFLLALAAFGLWLHFRPRPFSPARWQNALGPERGRMVGSLRSQTDFVGFTRASVEIYLGTPNFDERRFWYDLGPTPGDLPLDPRAAVGDSLRLCVAFSYDPAGAITDVLYNHRRPTLGSAVFDSLVWLNRDHAPRTGIITNALGRIRARGMSLVDVQDLLGPADGARVRAHYDVGSGGTPFGSQKALTLEYNPNDVVTSSAVID